MLVVAKAQAGIAALAVAAQVDGEHREAALVQPRHELGGAPGVLAGAAGVLAVHDQKDMPPGGVLDVPAGELGIAAAGGEADVGKLQVLGGGRERGVIAALGSRHLQGDHGAETEIGQGEQQEECGEQPADAALPADGAALARPGGLGGGGRGSRGGHAVGLQETYVEIEITA